MHNRSMIVVDPDDTEGQLEVRTTTGVKTIGEFGVNEIEKGLQRAKKESGWCKNVILTP
jgi:hypothetical protein